MKWMSGSTKRQCDEPYAQVVSNSPDYVGGWVDLNMSNTRGDMAAIAMGPP
jgi:hypothetical protein